MRIFCKKVTDTVVHLLLSPREFFPELRLTERKFCGYSNFFWYSFVAKKGVIRLEGKGSREQGNGVCAAGVKRLPAERPGMRAGNCNLLICVGGTGRVGRKNTGPVTRLTPLRPQLHAPTPLPVDQITGALQSANPPWLLWEPHIMIFDRAPPPKPALAQDKALTPPLATVRASSWTSWRSSSGSIGHHTSPTDAGHSIFEIYSSSVCKRSKKGGNR